MSSTVLTNVQLLLGAYDVSGFSGKFDIGVVTEMKPANNFAALGYTVVLPGLTKSLGLVSGWSDYGAGGINQSIRAAQVGSQQAFTVIPTGTAAVAGDPAQFMEGRLSKFHPLQGAVGTVAGFAAEITGDTADVDGFVGVPLGARSSLTGTAVQMGQIIAGDRLWAALHVTAAVGTNLAVSIAADNSSGFPSPVTQLTFPTTSTVGWQFMSVPGPLADDWFKVSATSTGSFTYAVVMGIL
jgi:hypothetical protein